MKMFYNKETNCYWPKKKNVKNILRKQMVAPTFCLVHFGFFIRQKLNYGDISSIAIGIAFERKSPLSTTWESK